jgi:N-acetylmuramoyl-L-alanine amidase
MSLRVPDALKILLGVESGLEASAHYAITPEGQALQFVAEEKRAWHAGVGMWRGQRDMNCRSIGIELIMPGPKNTNRSESDCPGPFSGAQMKTLAELSRGICQRWNMLSHNVVAHSDLTPGRISPAVVKRDPGELFDWKWLASKGVGLYPKGRLPEIYKGDMMEGLAQYGYDTSQPNEAMIAFRRHFGFKDSEATLRRKLAWLLKKAPAA